MPDETDAKILTAAPLKNWRVETTRTHWNYVDKDYSAGPEIQ